MQVLGHRLTKNISSTLLVQPIVCPLHPALWNAFLGKNLWRTVLGKSETTFGILLVLRAFAHKSFLGKMLSLATLPCRTLCAVWRFFHPSGVVLQWLLQRHSTHPSHALLITMGFPGRTLEKAHSSEDLYFPLHSLPLLFAFVLRLELTMLHRNACKSQN